MNVTKLIPTCLLNIHRMQGSVAADDESAAQHADGEEGGDEVLCGAPL